MGEDPVSNVDPAGLAYFGVRPPLQGLPWLGLLSNNQLDNAMNTAVAYEQPFFEDNKAPDGCRRLPRCARGRCPPVIRI